MGKLTNREKADARRYVEDLFIDGKITEEELDEQLADLQPDRGPLKAAIASGVAFLLIGGGFGIEIGHRIATSNAAEMQAAAPAVTITHTKAVPVTVTAPAPRTTAPPTTTAPQVVTPPTTPPTSSAPRTTPGPSPEVREWMERVNEGGSSYGPEDAEWACEQLDRAGDDAAWDAVGSERMIWAGRLLCTEYVEAVERAAPGFREGDFVVGDGQDEIKPGTYVTRAGVESCYWERMTDSGTIIANDFVSFSPKGVTVTIRASDGGFTSTNCGPWTLAA